MPNREQSLLYHRENYAVPKGQERLVHYQIAKMNSEGGFLEKPRVIATDEKLFESVVKRNLELQGYVVEILYHPSGKYSNLVIRDRETEMKEKDAEIARLKAIIAEQEAKAVETAVAEAPKTETAVAEEAKPSTKAEEKRVGRPSNKK